MATRTVTAAGFTNITIDALDGEMDLGADANQAYGFALGLLGWMLAGLDDTTARRAQSRTIDAHTTTDGVRFGAATC